MKKININENLKIQDSINNKPLVKGVIRIYDKDNNLIKEINNMVVTSGSILIKNLFAYNIRLNDTAVDRNHLYLHLSYNKNQIITASDLEFNDIHVTDTGYTASFELTNAITTSESASLEFSANISYSIIHAFNQIYLSFRQGTTGSETLFSRAIIDPVFLGANDSYQVTYTLYF